MVIQLEAWRLIKFSAAVHMSSVTGLGQDSGIDVTKNFGWFGDRLNVRSEGKKPEVILRFLFFGNYLGFDAIYWGNKGLGMEFL